MHVTYMWPRVVSTRIPAPTSFQYAQRHTAKAPTCGSDECPGAEYAGESETKSIGSPKQETKGITTSILLASWTSPPEFVHSVPQSALVGSFLLP
jgi:hypothetical protein